MIAAVNRRSERTQGQGPRRYLRYFPNPPTPPFSRSFPGGCASARFARGVRSRSRRRCYTYPASPAAAERGEEGAVGTRSGEEPAATPWLPADPLQPTPTTHAAGSPTGRTGPAPGAASSGSREISVAGPTRRSASWPWRASSSRTATAADRRPIRARIRESSAVPGRQSQGSPREEPAAGGSVSGKSGEPEIFRELPAPKSARSSSWKAAVTRRAGRLGRVAVARTPEGRRREGVRRSNDTIAPGDCSIAGLRVGERVGGAVSDTGEYCPTRPCPGVHAHPPSGGVHGYRDGLR